MSADTAVPLTRTPRCYRVLARADEIARAAGSPDVGPEHLLLAIVHDVQAVPTQVLGRLADLDRVENALLEVVSSPGYSPPGPARPAAGTEPRAAQVAATMGHSHIGVEHLFLAIIGDRDCAAAGVLARYADPGAVEAAVIAEMKTPGYRGEPDPGAGRVFLPDGLELDRALAEAIAAGLPEGATFGVNWENGRQWVRVIGPGDTREVLNAALASLGRPGLD